ncbi:MAG: twin-arginine translocase subunit TatC [Bacteroidales bacterium]|nr:twin-arginine translocase subunit TatC [Bacteroidales bacterium]MDY6347122.1 twin-arginine translocase subunit TatC [Bacteroidales bacterium]
MPDAGKSFWDHLDDLRTSLIRIVIAVAVFTVLAFCFKDLLFRIVLAPKDSSFFIYRLLRADDFSLNLMNVGLTEQFMVHLKAAFALGVLMASPYVIKVLFDFVSPALYENEKKHSTVVVVSAYVMFMMGVALNYLLIFPLTVRFLGTYQVSPDVANMLTLDSYMSTLLMMSIVFGIVFEVPVVCWILARLGLLRAESMTEYRRHAIVAILVIAAVITPTADAFTLLIVSLPIWLLYEASILIVKSTERKTAG